MHQTQVLTRLIGTLANQMGLLKQTQIHTVLLWNGSPMQVISSMIRTGITGVDIQLSCMNMHPLSAITMSMKPTKIININGIPPGIRYRMIARP